MSIATGLVSAFLAFLVQSGRISAPDPTCASTPYGDAWGRTSPSGTILLCRVPAARAGVPSLEYVLRAGGQRLWSIGLSHTLDEAVVGESGEVHGFATLDEARASAPTAYVVAIAPNGYLRREWRFEVESKWFICGSRPPAVTGIARVDAFCIAVRTG